MCCQSLCIFPLQQSARHRPGEATQNIEHRKENYKPALRDNQKVDFILIKEADFRCMYVGEYVC